MIINKQDISNLARPISTDDKVANALIREAEVMDIIPKIGINLYNKLHELEVTDPLLVGGVYLKNNISKYFSGLKTATAYYSLARIMMDGGDAVTRFGAVQKNDEYSTKISHSSKVQKSNTLTSIADTHMVGVMEYLTVNNSLYPEFENSGKKIKNTNLIIKKIGD